MTTKKNITTTATTATTNSTTAKTVVVATPNGETTFNVLRFITDRKKLLLGIVSETDTECTLVVINNTLNGYVVNTTYPIVKIVKSFDIATSDFRQTVLSTVNDYRRGQSVKTHFSVLKIAEYDGLKSPVKRGDYDGKKPQSDKSLSSKIDSVRRQISVLKQKLVDAEKQLSELLEQQQQQQQLAKRADTVSALTSQLLSATTADERNTLLTKLAELVNA